MASETNGNGGSPAAAAKNFNLRQIFVKDLSFESPNPPEMVSTQPEIKLTLETNAKNREGSVYDVVLQINVHAQVGEKSLFMIEVQQAGQFDITGFNQQETAYILKTKAPEILYPYARELISTLVTRGGFPQLLLQPISFDALYAEQQARKQA